MDEIAVLDKFLEYNEVEDLINRIRKNPKTALVLRGNCLGAEGADILGRYLSEEACELITLSLEWNQLGTTGCTVLAKSLEKNTSLTSIDLRNNSIKNDGAIALANCLQVNQSLRSIDLRWNQITDAVCFKDSLVQRQPPLNLQINGNHLPETSNIMLQAWINGDDEMDLDTSNTTGIGDGQQTAPAPGVMDNNENVLNVNSNETQLKGKSSISNMNLNSVRTAGMMDAANARLQKETAILRKQCSVVQEEVSSMGKQLEISAVQITELEQKILKEEYRAMSAEELVRSTTARFTTSVDERIRLTNAWQEERDNMMQESKNMLIKRDEELSAICIERDKAVQDMNIAQLHREKTVVQMEDIARVNNQERLSLQEEINVLKTQLTEVTLSESRLKTEATILETRVTRAEEEVKRIETDRDAAKEEAENDYKKAIDGRNISEDKMKEEYHTNLQTANMKIASQNEEIANMSKLLSSLDNDSSNMKADMELKLTNAVAQARNDEAKRAEITMIDLKDKINMFLTSRQELEKRCDNYLKELTEHQNMHKATNLRLTTQLNTSEAEGERLRNLYNDIKSENVSLTEQTNAETEAKKKVENELKELQTKLNVLEGIHVDIKDKLSTSMTAQNILESKTRDYELKQDKYDNDRQIEFFSIKRSIERTLQREFCALQTSLGVPPQSLSHNASPVTAKGDRSVEETLKYALESEGDDDSGSYDSSSESEDDKEVDEEEESSQEGEGLDV